MEDSQNLSKNQCIFVKINVFLYTTLDPIPKLPPLTFYVLYFDDVLHWLYNDYSNHSEHNNGSSFLFKNLFLQELDV
jgi:hypothetical protein